MKDGVNNIQAAAYNGTCTVVKQVMLSRQQELRAYYPNIYTVGTSCKRRREEKKKNVLHCIDGDLWSVQTHI